ncbi:MAG TPA: alpha/beta fold hydrolase [Roseiflexaceae bacterium]|nr:alpha/beta fold hydrolase [Roseiflexaceae bacterium]
MPIRLTRVLLFCVLLAGCTTPPSAVPTNTPVAAATPLPTATPVATTTPLPTATALRAAVPVRADTYEVVECRFTPPAGVTVECGDLLVPEDRSTPEGRQIRLHVALFRSRSATPAPDPIIYLEGGPGGHALARAELAFNEWFAPLLDDRDLIIFDQRGTGFSEPSLACGEITELGFELLDKDIPSAEANQLFTAAALRCRDRLAGEGINLAMYNSVASAADVADLRIAMGYAEWNLLGVSYGTRLALTTMRNHPQGIRSVVLDSSVPLQSREVETPANMQRAFRTLFDGCAAASSCAAAYPDLEADFYDLVERLNQNPVIRQANDPLSGEQYTVLLNGDSIISLTAQALYSSSIIPLLPIAIYGAARDIDYTLFAILAVSVTTQNAYFSYGMLYSVRCHEEIAFETREALAAADDPFPEQRGVFDVETYLPVCDAWGAGAAEPIENEPVVSDLPALVLAGEYDPATPPEDGRITAAPLSNSHFFEFPGLGHGVSLEHSCARRITLAFFADPSRAPPATCIANLAAPAFIVPRR